MILKPVNNFRTIAYMSVKLRVVLNFFTEDMEGYVKAEPFTISNTIMR